MPSQLRSGTTIALVAWFGHACSSQPSGSNNSVMTDETASDATSLESSTSEESRGVTSAQTDSSTNAPGSSSSLPSQPATLGSDEAGESVGPDAGADSSQASSPLTTTDGGSSLGPDDTSSEQPFPDIPPTETSAATVPTVRQEHAVVALNDEIYVLGGFTPSATDTVQAYSPATDTWRDIADFPVVFHHANAGAVDGKLYVAGFLLGSSLSDGDGRVFAYDPAADEWSPRTSMPAGTDRGSACVTTLGARLYVFGGASSTTLPDVSAYDTVGDSWEELSFMPQLREHCVAAAVDGLIYIVSGRAGSIGGVGPESFVYDPATDTYDDRAPIPTPRGGTAGALLHGRIFVFGGEGNQADDSGVFTEIEAYDPTTDTWHGYPAMTIPRHGFGAATLGDRIYLPGGGTSQGFGAAADHTVFAFSP